MKEYPGGTPPVEGTERKGFWLSPVHTNSHGIHCKIAYGDVLLLNPYVIHESMPNISEELRINLDLRFYKASVDANKYWLSVNDKVKHVPDKEK